MKIEQWLTTELGQKIWKGKYQHNNESLDDWFDRVSGGDDEVTRLIQERKFLFGGRTLSNRGLNDGSYSNCYSSGYVEDDFENILDVNKNLGLTYKAQGGQGVSLSKIRPKGSLIKNRYESDGIVPIMEMYNTTTESTSQGGSRKGALMLSIDITHKEAETFITIKSDLDRINKANLSVEIDDEFMELVVKSYKDDVEHISTQTRTFSGGQVITYDIVPIKLYKLLIKQAWMSAEPGVLFVNKFRNYNLMECVDSYAIETCNPCGEQPLPKNGACNLGSMNLAEYIDWNGEFDFTTFKSDVHICVKALDDIIDENLNNHALEEQRKFSKKYRNIGLGVMGYADMLIKAGLTYGSKEAVELTSKVLKAMFKESIIASTNLADEFGAFPEYETQCFNSSIIEGLFSAEEIFNFKVMGLRNSSLLSIAPTGSLGTMFNISTGIEPNFSLEYVRKTESLEGNKESFHKVFAGIASEYTEKFDTDVLPAHFVTSHNIGWKERIDMQAAAQKYIDTAISATINLPKDITVEEVEDLYIYAWEQGLKGVTIYRDGCREGILTLEAPTEEKKEDFFIRGEVLDANVVHFINDSKPWIAFIGTKDGKPFEIFSGPTDIDMFPIPKSVSTGKIIKVKNPEQTRYDFSYTDSYGYQNTLGGLSRIFDKEYYNYARLISGMLRNQLPVTHIINIVDGMHFESESMHSWKNGVIRALKTFVADGTETSEKCAECGDKIIYTGGCKQCAACGWSKC